MKDKIKGYFSVVLSNNKIVENYVFMTVIQVVNSFFYLLVYPFIIRTLGMESYGLYVLVFSIITYFSAVINYGFDMPAMKSIAENQLNKSELEKTISEVISAKITLQVFITVLFIVMLFTIPFFKENIWIFVLTFINTFAVMLLPQWFFQGVQKMKIVTYIQFGLKILSIPFILFLLNSPEDNWIFALIVSMTNLLASILSVLYIRIYEQLQLKIASHSEIMKWLKNSLPFFWTNSVNILKMQSATIVVGSLFGLKEVALYDLAYKIFQIPVLFLTSVNTAIFPKIVQKFNFPRIKKIIKNEFLFSILIVLMMVIFGKYAVSFLGGDEMMDSNSLLIILSLSITTILTVGAIQNFIFVMVNKSKYIALNQTFAFIIYAVFLAIGILLKGDILVVPVALTISSFFELGYCYYKMQKLNLNEFSPINLG